MTHPEGRAHRGFSLLELAVVLTIVSLLAIGSFSALRISRQQSVLQDTRRALDQTTQVILAFAVVKGNLPCPDTDVPPDGQENRTGQNCTASRGGVPWRSLGIAEITAQDGWAQGLRYLVTSELARDNPAIAVDISLSLDGKVEPWDGTQSMAVQGAIAFALWSAGEDRIDASADAPADQVRVPPGGAGQPVDDIVTWTSRYTLIARLLEGGRNVPN